MAPFRFELLHAGRTLHTCLLDLTGRNWRLGLVAFSFIPAQERQKLSLTLTRSRALVNEFLCLFCPAPLVTTILVLQILLHIISPVITHGFLLHIVSTCSTRRPALSPRLPRFTVWIRHHHHLSSPFEHLSTSGQTNSLLSAYTSPLSNITPHHLSSHNSRISSPHRLHLLYQPARSLPPPASLHGLDSSSPSSLIPFRAPLYLRPDQLPPQRLHFPVV
ncbi:uncharacterized protein [Nothobranchius furzeri]|uniref:uncharacterized protein n=1 Tax=Nothobranchius furzeri TaxID=105023 RepID=UPI0039047120